MQYIINIIRKLFRYNQLSSCTFTFVKKDYKIRKIFSFENNSSSSSIYSLNNFLQLTQNADLSDSIHYIFAFHTFFGSEKMHSVIN